MAKCAINCFRCNKQLDAAAPDSDRLPIQPYGGVMFRAGGNYGSTIWDPQVRSWELHIIICDDCMLQNKQNIVHSQLNRVAKYSYELWNPAPWSGED